MTGLRWERLVELFHAVRELPPAERAAHLGLACDDSDLRREVLRLCDAHERAGGFIETPALAVAGSWLDAPSDGAPVGRRFGPYRVVREIGRGGMGAVYLAERDDGQFRQRVALKLIKRGMDTDLVLRRFRAERQILASLDHPNIARLLDGGTTDDGRPYFVMEHVDGRPIDEYADAHRLSVSERLRLFLPVCAAVACAHRQRVVHRDIKPANILVPAEGAPRLLDFGIAKVLNAAAEDATTDVTGFRLLTPEYASPEQVERQPATEASDVYSLGVVLYELLTGRSPYGGGREALEAAEAVRTVDPERPSSAVTRSADTGEAPRREGLEPDRAAATRCASADRLGRQLRGDLDTIVLTALRKEPERRYASVEELAEDLRRHLAGLPVRARRDNLRYRGAKYLRRNRAPVLAAAGAVAAVLALGAGFAMLLPAAAGSQKRALPPRSPAAAVGDVASATDARPLVAITGVRTVGADTADRWLAAGVPQMLTMALARAGLDLVAPARVRDAVASAVAGGRDEARAEATAAARLGANRQVSGFIRHDADGFALQLTVRGTAAGSDPARISVVGPDLLSVVDQSTARLLAALDAPAAGPRLEDVETRSVDAYRSFVAGLQLNYEGRGNEAVRAYDAAIAADSGFVSAVVYRLLATPSTSPSFPRIRALYLRLHDRAPEFDRLSIEAYDAAYAGEADRAEALVRRLVQRFPRDPRSYDFLHSLLVTHGRFGEAAQVLAQRLALDSLAASAAGGASCGLCMGYAAVAVDLLQTGDAAGAERVARHAVELQPQRPTSWAIQALALMALGRYGDAIRAQEHAVALAAGVPQSTAELIRRRIEARQYEQADSALRLWRGEGAEYVEAQVDLRATLLRERGRYAEAAATLEAYLRRDPSDVALALVLGHTLGSAGRARAAARTFETRTDAHALRPDVLVQKGIRARAFAWPHALLADALYLAGSTDTVRLRALADSVQAVGAHSYYARDWRLYHHILGLIAMRAGRWAEAEREFHAARFGHAGWTRTLVELANAQLEQGRASAAIGTLRAAYQAPLDGMGRYATRSELDLLMARAFAAAGEPDSAATYAGYVRAAWAHADPRVRSRLRGLPAGS